MATAPEEAYSNPLAPPSSASFEEDSRPQKLTNADFRKLMMTPRVSQSGARESFSTGTAQTENEEAPGSKRVKDMKEDAKASERKKKKSYYARIKKEEEEKMAELAERYRDRARERRDGKNPDYTAEDPTQAGMGAYRSVAPDVKSGFDAAEKRKQVIQESKFLGGDMEHTHLVKGLDYALLQKVRSEITIKETEVEPDEPDEPQEKKAQDGQLTFSTAFGKRTYNAIFSSSSDSFTPGRIAYSIDLEEEAESDIPITVVRSKLDMTGIEHKQATFSTNDIVIQKLTQILSYLRTGKANKKHKKKDKAKDISKNVAEENIYADIGEYVPTHKSSRSSDKSKGDNRRSKNTSSNGENSRSYFDRPPADELKGRSGKHSSDSQWYDEKETAEKAPEKVPTDPKQAPKVPKPKTKRAAETDFYTECYPGMAEMQDAIEDSDDEADYTKMDLGNKKGPVGRWDFDTQEEYSDYMNQREAMPKAAFQYGVKMTDGRKTRRIGTNKEKDKNSELNREWQQIQQILKRRSDDSGKGRAKRNKYA